jgi:tRNA modification GTPase
VLDACARAGARRADAGEFTRRAYLRGKLDLVQAEAVADLVEARSRAMRRAALGHLERGLSARVAGLREALVEVEAVLAHHIDFPEEDDAPVPTTEIAARGSAVARDMRALLASAPEGELLREGALAVLAGRPNTGKSSLYNALIGEERAIVTEEPGTTRDALVTAVQLAGFPFRLVDTAGLREAEGNVERLGIEVTRRYLRQADVVLLCVPAGEGISDVEVAFLRELGDVSVVLIETKVDERIGGGDPGADDEGPAGRARAVAGVRGVTPAEHRAGPRCTGVLRHAPVAGFSLRAPPRSARAVARPRAESPSARRPSHARRRLGRLRRA